MSKEKQIALADERIISKIYLIRGKKVMMDYDLSEMYAVETAQLKRQVRRNIDRFPEDFMFELTAGEYESLRCQFGILKKGRGQHSKHGLMAFTEQGVAMLSSVLNSPTAIEVNRIAEPTPGTPAKSWLSQKWRKRLNPPDIPREGKKIVVTNMN